MIGIYTKIGLEIMPGWGTIFENDGAQRLIVIPRWGTMIEYYVKVGHNG